MRSTHQPKSIDTSQFLDPHMPFIYRTLLTQWKQSTFHSFALERRRHSFYYNIYMYQIVCCVKQIIRKYNESHKLCSYKLTLLSLICDTHEMNIQRQTSVISNFLYIEVFTQVPWTSIYPSFTVFGFDNLVVLSPFEIIFVSILVD